MRVVDLAVGSAPVRKFWWKWFYGYTTRRTGDDMQFFNWSYEEDPPMAVALGAADEPYRYPIQLYHATVIQGDGLAGKRVLEVGCGHGGGASYLTRTLKPASYLGLDMNAAGIRFCRQRHQNVPKLDFVRGNAEDLPFDAASFDVVINVESSHCYPRFDRFLNEVSRVLRPDGVLLYTDFRKRFRCAEWEAMLAGAPGLRVVSSRDISAEVARGMALNSAYLYALADSLGPRFLRQRNRRSAPVRGSQQEAALGNGQLCYRMYNLAKVT